MNQKEYDRRRHELAKPAYAALMKFYPLTIENLDGEIWRTVPDYDAYQVSNFGRVKRLWKSKAKILKPKLDHGYLRVALCKDGKMKYFFVHRLVALVFIPNPNNLPEVNHRDGHKLNNYVENLEWATRLENAQHASETGLYRLGEESPNAKLTNEQALYVRNNPDNLTGKALAEKFAVDPTTIGFIQTGKSYKNAGGSLRKAQKHSLNIPAEIRAQIRAEYVKGSSEFSSLALAKKYGIGKTTILRIVRES